MPQNREMHYLLQALSTLLFLCSDAALHFQEPRRRASYNIGAVEKRTGGGSTNAPSRLAAKRSNFSNDA